MLKICNEQELIEKSEGYSQIVCFGLGKRFERLYQLFGHTIIWDKIYYVIDNNKQGRIAEINKKKIEIISITDLKRMGLYNYSIIITPLLYDEIVEQLNEDRDLQIVDFYCLSHTIELMREKENLEVNMPVNIRIYKQSLIPKTIHYCWFGKNPIPDRYKKWMESWSRFCPDYEILEWNETNYDVTKNKYMYQAYKNEKWAFVPDYARLDIIYNYGGVYLDTDVELIQNIDDLLFQKGFAGFETREYVALGLGFGAVKGLPIVKKMLDMYNTLDFINSDGNSNLVASPYWQTEILKKSGLCTNGEYQIVEDMTIYPIKVLNGKSIFRDNRTSAYPKSIHHYEGSSWQEKRYITIIKKNDDAIKKYYAQKNIITGKQSNGKIQKK